MFNTRKITIEYENIKGVFVPVAVKAKGLELRDVCTICKRFLCEGNSIVKKENALKIKEIKESKDIRKPGKSILIKLIKDVDTPTYVIEEVRKKYSK